MKFLQEILHQVSGRTTGCFIVVTVTSFTFPGVVASGELALNLDSQWIPITTILTVRLDFVNQTVLCNTAKHNEKYTQQVPPLQWLMFGWRAWSLINQFALSSLIFEKQLTLCCILYFLINYGHMDWMFIFWDEYVTTSVVPTVTQAPSSLVFKRCIEFYV